MGIICKGSNSDRWKSGRDLLYKNMAGARYAGTCLVSTILVQQVMREYSHTYWGFPIIRFYHKFFVIK